MKLQDFRTRKDNWSDFYLFPHNFVSSVRLISNEMRSRALRNNQKFSLVVMIQFLSLIRKYSRPNFFFSDFRSSGFDQILEDIMLVDGHVIMLVDGHYK